LESSRPVPTFTLGFLPGIIAGLLLFPDPAPLLLPVLLIAAVIAVLVFSAFRPGFIKVVLCGLMTGLAAVAAHAGFYGRNHIRFHVDKIEGTVSVTGIIIEPPISRAMLSGEKEYDNKQAGRSRKFSYADRQAKGEIQIESVTMPDGKTANIHGHARIKFYKLYEFLPVGSRIRLTCNIYRPFAKSTPGGFDFRAFLARNKIFANIVVKSSSEIEVLGRRGFHPLADLRAAMVKLTVSTFGEKGKAEGSTLDFLLAILLGERRLLTNERRDAYITSGTAHILAISGLHLALFAAFLGIALWFIPRRPRMLVIGIAVTLYAAIAGFRPSVLRALVMILFYLGAVFFRRQRRGLDAIAAAAVFVLLVNPFDLIGPGFQLSFGGVLGIMFLARPLERLMTREEDRLFERLAEPEFRLKGIRLAWSFLRANLVVSLAAWLATGPLVAYYFHIVTPLAVILSVAACLFIWVVIGGGFLALALVAITGITALARPIEWAVQCFHTIISLPEPLRAYWYIGDFSAVWLLVYYLFLLILAFRDELSRRLPFPVRRMWIGFGFVLFAVAFILTRLPEKRPARFELAMLDVGDMSCMVARTPEGGILVYDCGAKPGFNAGRSVLSPYLWHCGVSNIDALVLSHAQMDHYGGAAYLLDKFKIGAVYVNRYFRGSPQWTPQWKAVELQKELAEAGIPLHVVGSGDAIESVPGLKINVLAPTDSPLPRRKIENETSLVVRLEWDGRRIMLTGDIEEYGYARLVESGADLSVDVVQVPHHGCKFENASDLARATGASIFLISNYASRLYADMVSPYDAAGEVHITGLYGTVTVYISGPEISVTRFLREPRASIPRRIRLNIPDNFGN